jgi:O-antigen ligase
MVFLDPMQYRSLGHRLSQFDLARVWAKRPSLLFGLCAVTLIASIMLGGGTHGGFLSDVILELLAIPAFLVSLSALVALTWAERKGHAEWALMLCLAIAILPLTQLIPLPPWLWTRLPHRESIAGVFDLLNGERPWLPISVSPSSTWISVLSLLPPFAVFFGIIQLDYRQRRLMSLVLLGVGVFAAFIGLLQVIQGPSSPLRFFAFTSDIEAVGFFANKNHFAAFLYVLFLFGAAWATQAAFSVGSWKDRKNLETRSGAMLAASLLILVLIITVEATTWSRAGLALMIVAVFGALALPITDPRRPSGLSRAKLLLGSAILVIVLVTQFGLYRIFDRFAVDPLGDARMAFARNTIAAAKAYMPFGSGVGTFVSVYPGFEPAQDAISNVYVNHAHNDFLEMWLEGGVTSIILVGAFLTWLLLRSVKIWWPVETNIRAIDLLLARAATIAIPLILAHSIVDYPLRTGAMMAVFAFSCAFLIEPLGLAPSELKPRVVPEISEAEKRRLARLQGLKVRDNASGALEGPPQWPVLAPPEETLADPSVEEGIEEDPFDVMISQGPLDLDEVSGAIEEPAKQLVDAPDEITERWLFDREEREQEPLRAAISQVPIDMDNSSSAPEQQFEPANPSQDDSSVEANVRPKQDGDIADMLDEFNQSSSVLVARSETGTTQGSEREDSGAFTGGRTWELAEAAQRKMRLFRSVTLVRPLEPPAPAEQKEPPRAASTTEAAPARPIDATQRELKVLRAVEWFVQSAGLPTPPAEKVTPAAAVTPQNPAQLVESEQNKGTLDPNIGEEVSVDFAHSVAESDLTPLIPATESEEDIQVPVDADTPGEAQPPQGQWGNEIEWPRQWQAGLAPSVTEIAGDGGQEESEIDPVSMAEAANPSENTGRALDNLAEPPAAAVREITPEPSTASEDIQSQAPVPSAKPQATAKAPAATLPDPPALPARSRWGEDIEWPEQWRK